MVGCREPQKQPEIGPVTSVSEAPYVSEPFITVDPTDPQRLAALYMTASDPDCDRMCNLGLRLASSDDGGSTWLEQRLYEDARLAGNGTLAYDPSGTLHVAALADGMIATAGGAGELSERRIGASLGADKPWLTIDPRDGTLYVAATGITGDDYDHVGVILYRSPDGGTTWSKPVAAEMGVPLSDLHARVAVPPFGAQALAGTGDDLAVVWLSSEGVDQWPGDVWIAVSHDRGETFESTRMAESWGAISSASHDGRYYVLHRLGSEQDQRLVISTSRDLVTWETHDVSGDIALRFDLDKAPGLGIAPDGTVDVVFYAHAESAPACFDMDAFVRRVDDGWVDRCAYHVYYTYSRDEGRTFAAPLRLTQQPILGKEFPRTYGTSRMGDYIGVASTNDSAHPV